MKNLVGIVQGRLSRSPKDRLQFFPKDWSQEFKIASHIGYDFIEFFTERRFNKKNPIWDPVLIKKYLELSKKNNLKIINFCDDRIISNSIKEKKMQNYLITLFRSLRKLKVRNLILPMYGKSNLTDKNYYEFVDPIKNILRNSKNIKILIESNISPDEFENFKRKINSRKLLFLFDTGNRINLKRDLYEDFKTMYKYVEHIHIKDKNQKKQNVKIGDGLVNFNKFFKILIKKNYKKNFTFETTRCENPVDTAKKNINFLKKKLSV